jgi:hypothetical protein
MRINDGKLYLVSATSLSPAIFDPEDGQIMCYQQSNRNYVL